jgi:hypothetical protein
LGLELTDSWVVKTNRITLIWAQKHDTQSMIDVTSSGFAAG